MTNSKIRNFFETLRSINKEDALLPFIYVKIKRGHCTADRPYT